VSGGPATEAVKPVPVRVVAEIADAVPVIPTVSPPTVFATVSLPKFESPMSQLQPFGRPMSQP
jgi:hypothetical protein